MLKDRVLAMSHLLWGLGALLIGLTLLHVLTTWGFLADLSWTLLVGGVMLWKCDPVPTPQSVNDMNALCEAAVMGWARALKLGNPSALEHSERTMHLAQWLGREMGLSETELKYLRWGALLHDIGKLGIPQDILSKPMHLSAEEFLVMQKHTEYGMNWMEALEFLGPAREVIYYHHEKWDGSGYPLQLHHEEIPYLARIFSVVDVYDALTSNRPYRQALPQEEALRLIRERVGTHFDPQVAKVFLANIKMHEPCH